MKNNKITKVFSGEAKWSRSAQLNLVGDKVIFDCSDGEYGPIEFDIELIENALKKHKQNQDEKEVYKTN